MPTTDKPTIDTAQFGHAQSFDRVRYADAKYWKVKYDTGLIMFVPEPLFETMTFNLDQIDRPKGSPAS